MQPFEPEALISRINRYRTALNESRAQVAQAETPEDLAFHRQQAALAEALLAGLEEAAAMVGVQVPPDIGPFA